MGYLNLLWHFFKLRGNAKKSKAEIGRIQEQKLRKLLQYAYDHSAYHPDGRHWQ